MRVPAASKCSSDCKTGELCEQLTPGRFTCVMDRGGNGGPGGATLGVVRNSGSTFTQNNVSFTLGTPGSGGSSSGNAGQSGSSVQVQTF